MEGNASKHSEETSGEHVEGYKSAEQRGREAALNNPMSVGFVLQHRYRVIKLGVGLKKRLKMLESYFSLSDIARSFAF